MTDFKKYRFTGKQFLLFAALIIAAVFVYQNGLPSPAGRSSASEIEQIKATQNLNRQQKLYEQLIRRVGPEQAQEELLRSGLPFTGQTHLLNHTVGEYLYQTEGPAGLIKCRDYFLSSCEHGFIILAIGDGGMEQVAKVFDVCRSNGSAVMGQCAHATGHGFLAWQGYRQLPEALKMCDQAAEDIPQFPLFNCLDGVFMENIWGVHEGKPSSDRWLKDNDPIYPCNDPKIEYKYLKACWSNQPARMYQLFNRDLAKIGQECFKISDGALKEICFNGLARQIHPVAGDNVDKVFELCGLLPKEWSTYCVKTNATASFSVGNRVVPFQICARFDNQADKQSCYEGLFGIMRGYARSSGEIQEWCTNIVESEWQAECNKKTGSP